MQSKESDAWFIAPADGTTRRAFIALSQGVASAGQQATAVNWLVQMVCRTHDVAARPDDRGGQLATYFAEGRRFVGLAVIGLMNQSLVAARAAPEAPARESMDGPAS